MAPTTTFDVIVLGGGSGGSAFARRAAGYGARVLLVDKGPTRDASGKRTGAGFGGTCVNVGCVPKKIMYNAAHCRETALGPTATAAGLGVSLAARRRLGSSSGGGAYVAGLNAAYERNWKQAGVEVLVGAASFVDARTIAVDGAATPRTSDDFFDLEELPKKVCVVGAGYIAVELAGILHGLGSDADLAFRGDTVLRRGFDPFVVETIMGELEAHGPNLVRRATPAAVVEERGKLTLALKDGRRLAGYDAVVAAVGRAPATAALRLENAGVAVDARGRVIVDGYQNSARRLRPSARVRPGYELTPVAIAAGRRLADRLFGGEPRARLDYADISTVVFSHPPAGVVGLTEPAALARYGDDVAVKESRFPSMAFALNGAGAKVTTALKLVLAGPEERVVGLHLVGPGSDEMLQGFAVALKMGATRSDFEAAVAIHPTVAEELVTFGGWGQTRTRRRSCPGTSGARSPARCHPRGRALRARSPRGLARR
ncbi:glutathione-disulfide reductase [Aureococcus anophagefferens]|nr:glutathione-disulfide reductase [Aureococcus anophagefferens]